jgi:hypothetical protein
MNTKCEKCIFKISDTNGIQSGCKFNITDKLLKYNKVYTKDNLVLENNSYILKNFYCPYARTDEWKKVANTDNIEELAILTSHQQYYFIIIVRDNNITNSLNILNNIINQNLLPKKISLCGISLEKINIDILQTFCIDNISKLNIIWKIHNMLDKDTTDSEAVDIALETSLTQETNMIYIINSETGDIVDIDQIYEIVNFHLNKPLAITSANGSVDKICIPNSLYINFYKKIGLVLDYLHNDLTNDTIVYFLQ